MPERIGRAGRAATTSRGRASDAITTQTANLRTYRRTKPTGPSNASAVATTPKRIFQNGDAAEAEDLLARARSRRSRSRSARTPTSRGTGGCSGRSAGTSRAGRAARAAAPSPARAASAPISPPRPSSRLPTTRGGDDRAERHRQREREPVLRRPAGRGTRPRRSRAARPRGSPRAGSRRTSRARRSRSGTGSMPQCGVSSRSSSLPSPA